MMKNYTTMSEVDDNIATKKIPHLKQVIQDDVVISNQKEFNQNIEEMEEKDEKEEEREKEVQMQMLICINLVFCLDNRTDCQLFSI